MSEPVKFPVTNFDDVETCLAGIPGRLAQAREAAGMTIRDAAVEFGITHPTIVKYEQVGSEEKLYVVHLLTAAYVYGVDPYWLLTGNVNPWIASGVAEPGRGVPVEQQLDEVFSALHTILIAYNASRKR